MDNIKMKKVLTFGSFDHIHPGHVYYLSESKKYGDSLIVLLANDATIEKVKGIKPKFNQKKRLQQLNDLNMADEIILGQKNDIYKVLDDVKPDVICLGYDQNIFTDSLLWELHKRNLRTRIIRIDALMPEKYKSSKLKNG